MGYVIRFLTFRNTSLNMRAIAPPAEHCPISVMISQGTTFAPYRIYVANAYPVIMITAPGIMVFIRSLVEEGSLLDARYDMVIASENLMANVKGAHNGYPNRRSASDEPMPADKDAIAGWKLSETKYIMASPRLKYIFVEGIGKYTKVANVVKAVSVAVIAMFLVCCCMFSPLFVMLVPFYMNPV